MAKPGVRCPASLLHSIQGATYNLTLFDRDHSQLELSLHLTLLVFATEEVYAFFYWLLLHLGSLLRFEVGDTAARSLGKRLQASL